MKTLKIGYTEEKTNITPILKLCNLKNSNWNRSVVCKCTICFEKFHNENSSTEHEKIHKQNTCNLNCINEYTTITSNETTVQNEPLNLTVKREPQLLNGEAKISTTKKSLNIGHLSSISTNINYEKASPSKSKFQFECIICKNTSINRHSFALHMINHQEHNTYECTVCDLKFMNIILWTKHMMYHQKQIDIKVAESEIISDEIIELNTSNTTNSENTKLQMYITTLENRKNEISSNMEHKFKNFSNNFTTLKNSIRKTKQELNCNIICTNGFTSKPGIMNNQPIQIEVQELSCKYCNKTFVTENSWINHEKTHTSGKNILFLNKTESKNRNPIEAQNNIKPYSCYICKNQFTMCCDWANHMKLRHNINPKFPELHEKYLSNVIDNTTSVKSINGSKIDLQVTTNKKFNKTIKQNLYCTICNKIFANISTFNVHVGIHSGNKPYKCRYCDRKFNMKGPFIIHERTQKCSKQIQNINTEHHFSIKNKQIENSNTSELYNYDYDGPNCINLVKKECMFICDVCDINFFTPHDLFIHRKLHGNIKPHICKICNTSYTSRYHWNRHLKCHVKSTETHSKKKSGPIATKNIHQCKICDKNFDSITNLRRHHTLIHIINIKAILCKNCGKKYQNEQAYKNHMRFIHKVLLSNDK